MATLTALYDACVLYPAPLRDILVRLGGTGLFRARWTNEIHDEWIRNLLKDRSDLTRERLERTRDLMNRHILDSLVTGYEERIPTLTLPDPGDRHVLAAAIQSGADLIITFNLKDFPASALAPHNIKAQNPDLFLLHLLDLDEEVVCNTLRQQHQDLKKPPVSMEGLLQTFADQGLKQFAIRLQYLLLE